MSLPYTVYTDVDTQRRRPLQIFFCWLSACLVLSVAGCTSKRDESNGNDASSLAASLQGVCLKLLVVDDPALASAVERFRGEWLAQSGSKLAVELATQRDLSTAGEIDADAVICPSHMVGSLTARGLIRPLPQAVVSSSDEGWQDLFELERRREAFWADRLMAVPLGSPQLVCYLRTDLLQRFNAEPPQTWTDYQRLIELFSDREKLGELAPPPDEPWQGAIEPLGPGWAGLMLLARAAPLAKHADNYSALFDIKTMRPLIDGPPFVRALEELIKAAETNQNAGLAHDPASARKAFWQGRCGLAVTWPTAAKVSGKKNSQPLVAAVAEKRPLPCTTAELPGSRDVYNIDELSWTTREKDESWRVPLLATSGRMGVVCRRSSHPQAAVQLLLWLSGDELSPPVAASSSCTTLYRKSQLRSVRQWVEAEMSLDAALVYGEVAERAFAQRDWLFALRIPGRDDYLAALDEAVRQAVSGKKRPRQALRETADRWRRITDRYGKQQQLQAYRKSLGLKP